jgi:hypothetical protein
MHNAVKLDVCMTLEIFHISVSLLRLVSFQTNEKSIHFFLSELVFRFNSSAIDQLFDTAYSNSSNIDVVEKMFLESFENATSMISNTNSGLRLKAFQEIKDLLNQAKSDVIEQAQEKLSQYTQLMSNMVTYPCRRGREVKAGIPHSSGVGRRGFDPHQLRRTKRAFFPPSAI